MIALTRWLLQRYWPRHGASDKFAPQYGNGPGRGGTLAPHCGNGRGQHDRQTGTRAPQCGNGHRAGLEIGIDAPQCGDRVPHSLDSAEAQLERADVALAALERAWSDTVALSRSTSAKEIAGAFHSCLAMEPDVVGLCVRSEWVRAQYPIFCEWLRSDRAPPYKDFARELAFLMPRFRQETWQDNRRVGTYTLYFVAPLANALCADMGVRKCA
jgi:hypothetical protein